MANKHDKNLSKQPTDPSGLRELVVILTERLSSFTGTLISIANCQNGIASHQAQDVLTHAGFCAHFNSVYRYRPENGHEGSSWICHDCRKESDERLMPFE